MLSGRRFFNRARGYSPALAVLSSSSRLTIDFLPMNKRRLESGCKPPRALGMDRAGRQSPIGRSAGLVHPLQRQLTISLPFPVTGFLRGQSLTRLHTSFFVCNLLVDELPPLQR